MPTLDGCDVFFMGNTQADGFDKGDVNFSIVLAITFVTSVSAKSGYSVVVAKGFVTFVGGFIPNLQTYRGHLDLINSTSSNNT